MNSDPNEGLLGSVLIYVSAVFGALALLGLPIYYAAIQPTVVENVGAERVHELLSARRTDRAFPVARLAEPEIFSPAVVTELHARAKEANEANEAKETKEVQAEPAHQRTARVAERASRSREVHHARAEVHQARAEARHSFARPAPTSPSAAAY